MLKYHESAVGLLPSPPAVSPENVSLLKEREARLRITFPAAVREWYGLEGAHEMLHRYSNQDRPVPIAELGETFPEWYGGGPRNFLEEGLVLFMSENQGVCNWAFRLVGDDPEVLVAVDSAPHEIWLPCVDTFSTFLVTRIWDFTEPKLLVQAQDRELHESDLDILRKHFNELPRSYGWPGKANYRFSTPEGRILIWDNQENQADWFISAPDEVNLELLLRQVWGCGTLQSTLYADDDSVEVLEKLRKL